MSNKSLKEKASSYSREQDHRNLLLNEDSRSKKADKIKAVLDREGAFLYSRPTILDIGCSHGYILKSLSEDCYFCVGVDMDKHIERQTGTNIAYSLADAEKLPFPSGSFDIVICNHVYEHTDDPVSLLAEIRRVLKRDGLCYFAGPSKFSLIEPHYHLPFLSWLPQAFADVYVRLTGKGDAYYVHPTSYAGFVSLFKEFRYVDYTLEIIENPKKYHIDDLIQEGSISHRIYQLISKLIPKFLPTYIFIIKPKF